MRNRYTSPFRLLLFLLTVFAVLFLLSALLPSEIVTPLKITMRLPSLETVIGESFSFKREVILKDKVLISEVDYSHYQPLFPDEAKKFLHLEPDTIKVEITPPLKADEKELQTSVVALQYSGAFLKEIHTFFIRISRLRESGEVIRILHYGDSQIEGDRITAEIRNNAQNKFGGMGPGLIPVVPPTRQEGAFQISHTGNWKRYSFQSKDIFHNRWGSLFGFARFTQPGEVNENETDVLFGMKSRAFGYKGARNFKKARLFFGYQMKPVYIEISRAGTILEADFFPPENNLKIFQYSWKEPVNNLTVRMKGKDSPDVFAVALDDHWGLAVDNIPLRGSSGLEFTRSDTAFLRKMFRELNTGMILLQFGVNVVPHVVGDYSYYENGLYRQLVLLKKLNPGVPVIILGVSDMSTMEAGVYRSYPNIQLIRNAQRNAALRAGCGFWDTYEAMGGNNSMVAWVFADPPLAQKDFTHFSHHGSKIIGQMFWNTLLTEYDIFIKTEK